MRKILAIYIAWMMALPTACFGTLRADINHDGRVDVLDLSILASEWLREEPMTNKYQKFGDGGNLYIPNDARLNLGTGNASICFWLNFNAPDDTATILHKEDDNYPEWWIQKSLQKLTFGTFRTGDEHWAAINYYLIGWNHVVFIRNGSTVTAYLNGKPVIVEGDATAGDLDNTNEVSMSSTALGCVDDLRIYKAALTAEEVAAIYNNGTQIDYNADQTPISGAAAFVMEFNEDFDVDGKIYSTIPAAPGQLAGTKTGGVTIEEGEIKTEEKQNSPTEDARVWSW